ncbi:MAG: RIP metalloprotease RseP [Candidatus Omnitrophica bacterium]|nr:RIP metalloprotease RseP [Candidatus Omnitrophota bacterium]
MLTWIIVFIVFGLLILVHEAGHLIAAKKAGIRVDVFSVGMGKRLFGVKIGDTDYRVSLIPFGGFCKMAGEDPAEVNGADDEFMSKPVGRRFWVVAAGSITNYLFAFILFSVIFMMGSPTLSNEVGRVSQGYPAEKAGIKVGDEIISINGKQTEYWDGIKNGIKNEFKAGNVPLEMEIKRGNRITQIKVTPTVSTVTNIFGQTISRPKIGIAPLNKILKVSYNPFYAVYLGGKKLLTLSVMTYEGIWLLITGGMPVKTSVAGPIGIAFLIGRAADLGIVHLMIITAHISMALAIFNLLPFPVLDGGHIVFLGIEKVRKRPLSPRVQEWITNAAAVLLISLVLFVSWQDILKFTPLGKQ